MSHSDPADLENALDEMSPTGKRGQDAALNLPRNKRGSDTTAEADQVDLPAERSLKQVEKARILQTLEETGDNRTHAAKMLGINRRTLQLKLKEYGVNGQSFNILLRIGISIVMIAIHIISRPLGLWAMGCKRELVANATKYLTSFTDAPS